ncbi:MAG: glutaredoxin family protein [Dehalococcoidia bacterium]
MSAVVTLYGRADCHLCDEAAALLAALRKEHGFDFTVEKVDITADPALERDYQWAIPVITCEGRELARAPVRRDRLEDALRAALALH